MIKSGFTVNREFFLLPVIEKFVTCIENTISMEIPANQSKPPFSPVNGSRKRRDVLKTMACLPIAGALGMLSEVPAYGSGEEQVLIDHGHTGAFLQMPGVIAEPKGRIPSARIKSLGVSRMIMGGNLIGGWAHARDLLYVSDLVKTYHTQEKINQTLQIAEQCGINSIITNPIMVPALRSYWKAGGKIQFISDGGFEYKSGIRQSVDAGAAAIYVHGGLADMLVNQGKIDEIGKALEMIRSQGLPAGIGGHELETIRKCVEFGLKPDFWMKTLHKTSYWSSRIDQERKNTLENGFADNIFCQDPDETIAYMSALEQPWIAYKILAAGAIMPKDAFLWAFEQGADFICVGMFDFQVVDNVNLAYDVLQSDIKRNRPWRA